MEEMILDPYELLDEDPATDGAKYFEPTQALWSWWHHDKQECRYHGFDLKKKDGEWMGVYRPFAPLAEGTKRL